MVQLHKNYTCQTEAIFFLQSATKRSTAVSETRVRQQDGNSRKQVSSERAQKRGEAYPVGVRKNTSTRYMLLDLRIEGASNAILSYFSVKRRKTCQPDGILFKIVTLRFKL